MNGKPVGMPDQPLSGKDYAIIAVTFVALGIGLLLGFAFLAPRVLPSAVSDQFYYVVLLLWGLVSALVLFGVLRGYARLTVKQPGVLLELGGPVVVAFLVVYGGFKLVPRAGSFSVTVRPHAVDAPVITQGKIRMEYGANPAIRDIDSSGDAEFREIPREYRGQAVKVLPQVDGYKQEYQTVSLDKSVIDLALTKESPETKLTGKIVPPEKGKVVKVLVEGENREAVPDEYGRFEMVVHRKNAERIRISVWVDGKQVYDDYQMLPGPVTLLLEK